MGGWLFAEMQSILPAVDKGAELQAALGCVYEHSFPASALQRGLRMLWAKIIAMGTFQWVLFHQEWCWW